VNAVLLVVDGNTTRRRVVLKLPCVLGRSRQADVTVAHPLISRRHCELSETDGLLMLRDLASLNGTMIGGRRVTTAPLLPDAEFTIGPLTFRVRYEYDGDLGCRRLASSTRRRN
jgi:pSer/pThr/pTyr-binding forkhead associated (FHA) protein